MTRCHILATLASNKHTYEAIVDVISQLECHLNGVPDSKKQLH